MVKRLNQVRRENRALQRNDNLTFHSSENPRVLFYRKAPTVRPRQWIGGRDSFYDVPAKLLPSSTSEEGNLLIAVTLDPRVVQESMVHVPLTDLGLTENDAYVVHDLLTGTRYTWRGARNYVRLDAQAGQVGHVFRVERGA